MTKTKTLMNHVGESENFRYDKMIPIETMRKLREVIFLDKNGEIVIENHKVVKKKRKKKIGDKFIKKFYNKKRRKYLKNQIKKELDNV